MYYECWVPMIFIDKFVYVYRVTLVTWDILVHIKAHTHVLNEVIHIDIKSPFLPWLVSIEFCVSCLSDKPSYLLH